MKDHIVSEMITYLDELEAMDSRRHRAVTHLGANVLHLGAWARRRFSFRTRRSQKAGSGVLTLLNTRKRDAA